MAADRDGSSELPEERERLESILTSRRSAELYLDPVRGYFDAAHLREVNRHIFQDLPGYGFKDVTPGVYRRPPPPGADWVKYRKLESKGIVLAVAYSTMDRNAIARLDRVLETVKPAELGKLKTAEFCQVIGKLYTELDYIHPFSDGNSRTLRVFTRQLAGEAGYTLDWERFNTNIFGRDLLYIARDKSVNALALENIRHRDTLRDVTASLNASGQSRDLPDLLRDAIRPAQAAVAVAQKSQVRLNEGETQSCNVGPDTPWIAGITTWPQSLEEAAEAKVQADDRLKQEWAGLCKRVGYAYDRPEAAMQAMRLSEAASPQAMEREGASSRIAGQLARDPSAFGALAGKTGLFASAAASAERERALVNVPALGRDLERYVRLRAEIGDLRTVELSRERDRARVDIPALSPAAGRVLERIRDAIDRNDLEPVLGFALADKQVKAELDRLNQALDQRFGERVFLGAKEAKGQTFEMLAAKVGEADRPKLSAAWPSFHAAQRVKAREQAQEMTRALQRGRGRGQELER